MTNAIEIRKITKKYREKTAVDNLELTVKEGELFSLLGVNGAGKTTTIRMLCGLTKPTNGDAVLLGESVVKDAHKVKEFINISPQETAIARNLTVYENLMLSALLYGLSNEEAKAKTEEMIKSFSLEEYVKFKSKKLSGGTQRRLSIAMALISEPKILFLDEPTLGLDVIARRELWNVIRQLKGKITVILTTHYMEEAEALSDRVAIMASGKLCAVGTVGEIIAQSGMNSFEDAFIKIATGGTL